MSIDGRGLETDYVYKSNGQLDYVEDAAGIKNTYYYDSSSGLVSSHKNDDNKYTRYSYDLEGRITHVWGNVPNPVKYQYSDPMGRLTRMDSYRDGTFTGSSQPSGFNSSGDYTIWDYDSYSGVLEKKTDSKGKYEEYTYNKLDQILSRTDGRGVEVKNEYYPAINPGTYAIPNALKKVDYPSDYNNSTQAKFTPDLTYTYYRHGGLRTVNRHTSTRTFSYDGNFDMYREDLGAYYGNYDIDYDFETGQDGWNGRLTGFDFQGASNYRNDYDYDSTGRLDQVDYSYKDWSTYGDPTRTWKYWYSYHSNANVIDFINSAEYQNSNWVQSKYTQDFVYRSDSYRLDKLIHNWGTGTSKKQEARFDYDNMGRKTYEKVQGIVEEQLRPSLDGWASEFSYNDRNELYKNRIYNMNSWTVNLSQPEPWTLQQHYFDNMGNRYAGYQDSAYSSTSTYAENELNQYTKFRSSTITHDDSGNTTNNGIHAMEYDAENRLIKVTIGTDYWVFEYDYLGRRISSKKKTDPKTLFVYDGWNLIAETNESDVIQRSFVWGLDVSTSIHGAGGVGGLLMIREGDDDRYFPIYDGSRNIVGLYDQYGNLDAAYEYDANGRILNQSGPYASDNPFRFSTKYTDEYVDKDSVLVYYGFRFYSPSHGRFVNRDPIGEAGGINLHQMTGNDSVNFYDFLGLEGEEIPTVTLDPFKVIGKEHIGKTINGQTYQGDGIWTDTESDLIDTDNPEDSWAEEDDPVPDGIYTLPVFEITADVEPEPATGWTTIDSVQVSLAVLGQVPGIGIAADMADALISAYRGDWWGFGIGMAAAVPIVGNFIRAGDWINSGRRVIDNLPPPTTKWKTPPKVKSPPRTFWTRETNFKGNRVFQRDDLIDSGKLDNLNRTNLERMQEGLAPLGPDSIEINLHHMIQTQKGGIAEVSSAFHFDNFSTIHINPNTMPSGIDRKAFRKWKREYWRSRANDF